MITYVKAERARGQVHRHEDIDIDNDLWHVRIATAEQRQQLVAEHLDHPMKRKYLFLHLH
jgi:hypothetical protein